MLDPLSIISSAAAAVGLIDVLLRSSKELYVFFGEIKDLSQNVKLLLPELGQLQAVFDDVRQWQTELSTSELAKIDSPSVLQVAKVLEAFRVELDVLQKLAEEAQVTDGDKRVRRMAKKLKWVFRVDGMVVDQIQRMKTLKGNLVIALSTSGRRGDLYIRRKIEETNFQVADLQRSVELQFRDIDATTKLSSAENQEIIQMKIEESATETRIQLQKTADMLITASPRGVFSLAQSLEVKSSQIEENLVKIQEKATTNARLVQGKRKCKGIAKKLDQLHRIAIRSTKLQSWSSTSQAVMNTKLDRLNTKIASVTISPDSPPSPGATIKSFNLALLPFL